MQSFLYHLQLNISFEHLQFYKELMDFLGWSVIFEKEEVIGFKSGKNGDLWFIKTESSSADYDQKGMNHLSIRVEQQEDINKVNEFLKQHQTQTLFETPRHRSEFTSSPNETYYQVMFASPDNILFEIVYIGEKNEK